MGRKVKEKIEERGQEAQQAARTIRRRLKKGRLAVSVVLWVLVYIAVIGGFALLGYKDPFWVPGIAGGFAGLIEVWFYNFGAR